MVDRAARRAVLVQRFRRMPERAVSGMLVGGYLSRWVRFHPYLEWLLARFRGDREVHSE
ncbi:MAG: hypothetical protein V3R24_07445 [Gemmatimonadales bacterium]